MKQVGIHRQGEIRFDSILEEVRRKGAGKAGAIGCFIGIVRGEGLHGGKVRFLEYEAHLRLAEDRLNKIREEIIQKYGLTEVMIHHMIGKISVGEDTFYVVVAGKHRKEVFDSLREIVDRVKKEVPIWKKEVTEEAAYWITK